MIALIIDVYNIKSYVEDDPRIRNFLYIEKISLICKLVSSTFRNGNKLFILRMQEMLQIHNTQKPILSEDLNEDENGDLR